MEVVLAMIRARAWRTSEPGRQLVDDYLARCARSIPATSEEFRSEATFWDWMQRRRGRAASFLAIADREGRQLSSEEFARQLAEVRDRGVQQIVLAIGPADGWSPDSLRRANLRLSFGKITLPHELAAVIAAEQLYRAATIWSGHPYHSGH